MRDFFELVQKIYDRAVWGGPVLCGAADSEFGFDAAGTVGYPCDCKHRRTCFVDIRVLQDAVQESDQTATGEREVFNRLVSC